MERSTESKNVSNYELLAKYYDYLLQDEDSLKYWLNYIEAKPFKTVLELASGSGVMANILDENGYDVIASDISVAMKEAAKNNFKKDYLILNMTDYNLDKKFDLILCICDSINYLTIEELDSFFTCAYKHLNVGGRLIFDAHDKERINEFLDEYIEEGQLFDGNYYQWTISSDSYTKNIFEHFTFYLEDGMIQEHHTQTVFEDELLLNKMANAGFIASKHLLFKNEKNIFIGEKR